MLQTLNFSGPRLVNAKANFFRYESGSAGGADESIRVRADGNDLGTFLPGDYLKLPVDASRWELTPTTPATAGVVRLGMGEVGSARLVGNVRVIDGERDKVKAGVCFVGNGNTPGVGTNGPFVYVANPAGSGKELFIQAVRLGSSVSDIYGIGCGTSWPVTPTGGITNLSRSGPASVALMTGNASGFGPAGAQQLGGGYIQASSDVVKVFPRPALIRPGECIYAYIGAVNGTIRASFEWEEWPV